MTVDGCKCNECFAEWLVDMMDVFALLKRIYGPQHAADIMWAELSE